MNPIYLLLPKNAECTAGRENSQRFPNYIEVIKEALREGYQDFCGWAKPNLFQQKSDLMDRFVTFFSAVVFKFSNFKLSNYHLIIYSIIL